MTIGRMGVRVCSHTNLNKINRRQIKKPLSHIWLCGLKKPNPQQEPLAYGARLKKNRRQSNKPLARFKKKPEPPARTARLRRAVKSINNTRNAIMKLNYTITKEIIEHGFKIHANKPLTHLKKTNKVKQKTYQTKYWKKEKTSIQNTIIAT